MDHRIGVGSYKGGNEKLLDKVFKSKPIKRGGKCYDLKLELRLYLGKDLREVKGSDISGKA